MNKRQYSTWSFGNPMSLRFEDGDGGETPAWHADHPCLADNPEASKKMAKYTTVEAAIAGAVDAQEKVGRPFWLPDDHSKLTDEHKTQIRANVAKMNNVPLTPEGYTVNFPDGAITDDQVVSELKTFAHKRGWSQDDAQGAADLHTAFVDRVNKATDETIGKRIKEGFAQYAKEVGGEATAALHMEWVKQYLESKHVDAGGKPDKGAWEDFKERNFYNNQGKEMVLLRELVPIAQTFVATGGGANATGEIEAAHKGSLAYAEMKKKK